MRVLFVNPLAGLGGSERSLLDVVLAVREADPGIVQRILLFEDGELAEHARAAGLDVVVEPLPRELASFGESGKSAGRSVLSLVPVTVALARYTRSFLARVNEFAPDVVHTNGMKAHLLAAAVLRHKPLLVHLRDFPAERRLSRHLLRALPRKRTLVIANSEAVAAEVRALAPALRCRAILNAIDLEAFSPLGRAAPLAELSQFPEAGGAVRVGLVATYAWWKGQRLFLEAARRVLDARPGRALAFYVVGGSMYRTAGSEVGKDELARWIVELGLEQNAGLVPFQRDVAGVYRALDVLVHASTKPEPFGRSVAEAMACGRAVVAARAGGVTELFEHGVSGLGFEPGSASELAAAIGRLAGDEALRARLGAEARRTAEARFERRRLARGLLDAYRELGRSGR